MRRKHNTVGGVAKTNSKGLQFERYIDLLTAISFHDKYLVRNKKSLIVMV